jgi:hypothetical protein
MRTRTVARKDILREEKPAVSKSSKSQRRPEELLKKVLSRNYGTIKVLSEVFYAESAGRTRPYVRSQCELCGTVRDRLVENLLSGKIKTCKCAPRKYDDDRKVLLSQRYFAMDNRCNNPEHPSWKYYGGRGIKNEFSSVDEYVSYVLEYLPHEDYKGVHIDRINNDGNYAKENLRCVPPKVNNLNTRRNKKVTYFGEQIYLAHLWHIVKHLYPEWPYGKETVDRLYEAGVAPEEMHLHIRRIPGGRPTTNKNPDPEVLALYEVLISKLNKESAK